MKKLKIPAVSIVGTKNAGKTTLIEKLIGYFTKKYGLKIATIKHDAHNFEIDHEGKDSYRHKKAGAAQVIIASSKKLALVKDVETEFSLLEIMERYVFNDDFDLVITEGFKKSGIPKIGIIRKFNTEEQINFLKSLENIIGFASETEYKASIPVFNLNSVNKIADFILDYFKIKR